MTPKRPNEAGETSCVVRWMVETPAGWLGAYDREAFDAFRAGWQPIETAPKDDDAEFLGCYREVIDRTWVGWRDYDRNPVYVHADYVQWEPTHWMPLPPLPSDL